MPSGWKEKLGEISSSWKGEVRWDEPLSRHTYYRIGGPADALVVPSSRGELESLSELVRQGADFFVLGMGSNLLVSDRGFRGLVIKCSKLDLAVSEESSPDGLWIRAGASVSVSTLLRQAGERGWDGLEFLTGVPGSVGGAVAMNAGTHLGEVKDRLSKCSWYSLASGQPHSIDTGPSSFEYRKNLFLQPGDVVLDAVFRVGKSDPASVKLKIQEVLRRRKATQPLEFTSCGSVFKNPMESGIKSWEVIDRLKLRGHRIGNAQFSEKHCNFIVNLGGAQAEDVKSLIDLAKSRARDELGIELVEEVKFLGF